MKRTMKRILTAVLILTMVVAAVPVQAGIPQYFPTKKTLTVYPAKTSKNYFFQRTYMGAFDKKSDKVTSVSSSNSSVAEAYAIYSELYAVPKKVGKTVITAKSGKTTRKCNLTVKKYVNPIASVKVGNSTIAGKKFDTEAYRAVSYSRFANKKAKITFNLKKGWSFVDGVSYLQKNWMKSEDVKNGAVIPIRGGSGFVVITNVVNDKTGQQEAVMLLFK